MVKIIKEELSFKEFNQEYNLDSILKKKRKKYGYSCISNG